jgi:hypothetical protein
MYSSITQDKRKHKNHPKKINTIEVTKKNFNISEVFEDFASIINNVKFTEEVNYRYILPAIWLKHLISQIEK